MAKKAAAPKTTIIAKITVASVCGKIKKPTEDATLLRVYGVAIGTKGYKSTYGEGNSLVGDFKAINLSTGQEFRASKAILPGIAQDTLEAQLSQGGAAQFALDIGITPSDKGSFGYAYTASPALELEETTSSFAALESKMLPLPA